MRDLASPQRRVQHVVLQVLARRDRPALLARARAAAGDRRARADALVPAPPRPRSHAAHPSVSPRDRPQLRQRSTLDGAAIDGRIDDAAYRALWGAWMGRERELYRECAHLVNALRWPDVLRAGGASVEARARVVAHAHRTTCASTTIPERLTVGQLQTIPAGRDRVLVTTLQSLRPARATAPAGRGAELLRRPPHPRGARAHPRGAEHQRPAVAGAAAGRLRRARGRRLAGIARIHRQRSDPTRHASRRAGGALLDVRKHLVLACTAPAFTPVFRAARSFVAERRRRTWAAAFVVFITRPRRLDDRDDAALLARPAGLARGRLMTMPPAPDAALMIAMTPRSSPGRLGLGAAQSMTMPPLTPAVFSTARSFVAERRCRTFVAAAFVGLITHHPPA